MNKQDNNTNKKYNIINLKKFENQELFEQYKQSSEYKEPNVALVGDTIMYNGNVSNSGGGSNSSTDENYMVYMNYDDIPQILRELALMTAVYVKTISLSGSFIEIGVYRQPALTDNQKENLISLAFMPNKLVTIYGTLKTLIEVLESKGALELYEAIPKITKEQFYNLKQ